MSVELQTLVLSPSTFVFFSGRSGSAVGLSAISFLAFASGSASIFRLEKDAAPIPNAEIELIIKPL